jgi:hypothetical protein
MYLKIPVNCANFPNIKKLANRRAVEEGTPAARSRAAILPICVAYSIIAATKGTRAAPGEAGATKMLDNTVVTGMAAPQNAMLKSCLDHFPSA